ncbi:hypothetical protein [Bradyrhizobium sp. OK095]|jgi:hypothetical protein|uniref:hypothetical protein n=1 Tax=Bradyrhizobium sp. OK095 TaxID=1882760 RepID=UPI0008B6F79B|nr:hypothetical protein [Bradyrhizobium sp. OK095]SEN70018.1 hypothetical protein SAMN05443254_110149 [Bradyrhizobium sp. OK095]
MRIFVLCLVILFPVAASAENINARLCGDSASNLQLLLSPAATQELAQYVKGLDSGKYAFSLDMTGDVAASQLGFRKRFATAYAELVETANALINKNGTVHIKDVVQAAEKILSDEQFIDGLADKPRWKPAIVYLRSIEASECAFPYTPKDLPTPEEMLRQLNRAYPEINTSSSKEFEQVYRATVGYSQNRIKEYGSVSIYQILAEWRRSIRSLALLPVL